MGKGGGGGVLSNPFRCCLIPFGVPGTGVPFSGVYWYAFIYLFTPCFPLQVLTVGVYLNA